LLEIASADFKGGIGCEDCELDRIERHLREAVEEAVKEERERIIKLNAPEIDKVNAFLAAQTQQLTAAEERGGRVMNPAGTIVHLPDAADAIKAVMFFSKQYKLDEDHDGKFVNAMLEGCEDVLAGERDTDAAKAIIGEECKSGQVPKIIGR